MNQTIDAMKQALETAKNGLLWYQDRYPQEANGCDDEAMAEIDAALASTEAQTVEPVSDGVRYRRLRILGCAPMLSVDLAKGTVLRFTNLDRFVDEDIRHFPGRGDGPLDKPESPAEVALRNIASALGTGGHNAMFVDAQAYERKILEVVTHPAPPAKVADGQRAALIEVLRAGSQYDEDGALIIMSRQACCEAADMLEADAQQVAVPQEPYGYCNPEYVTDANVTSHGITRTKRDGWTPLYTAPQPPQGDKP